MATKKTVTKKAAKKVVTKKAVKKVEPKKVATKKAVKKAKPSYESNVPEDNSYLEPIVTPQPLLPEEEAQLQEYLANIKKDSLALESQSKPWYKKVWQFLVDLFSI